MLGELPREQEGKCDSKGVRKKGRKWHQRSRQGPDHTESCRRDEDFGFCLRLAISHWRELNSEVTLSDLCVEGLRGWEWEHGELLGDNHLDMRWWCLSLGSKKTLYLKGDVIIALLSGWSQGVRERGSMEVFVLNNLGEWYHHSLRWASFRKEPLGEGRCWKVWSWLVKKMWDIYI